MPASTYAMEIAKIILSQLKYDYWFLQSLAAEKFTAIDETKKSLGGLSFRVSNCSKVKNGLVRIELTPADLYTVSAFHLKRLPNSSNPALTLIGELKDIYAEDLFVVIDGLVG